MGLSERLAPALALPLAALLALSACATRPRSDELELRVIRKTGVEAAYSYTVEYPAFPGHPEPTRLAARLADEAVARFVGEATANRKAWEATASREELAAGRPPFELAFSWRAERLSPEAVSILFESYSFVGGAHGALELAALNYDPRARRLLGLADLLEGAGPDWLEALSRAARARLEAELGREPGYRLDEAARKWIEEGTAPEPGNFSLFTFGPADLTIRFKPYQVAPWSAGSPGISLPRDARKW